jgi:hypothetical protein
MRIQVKAIHLRPSSKEIKFDAFNSFTSPNSEATYLFIGLLYKPYELLYQLVVRAVAQWSRQQRKRICTHVSLQDR